MVALVAALVVAGLGGCGGSSAKPDGGSVTPARAAGAVGITDREFADGRGELFLSRLDAATLAPRGRRATVGEFQDTWSVSPDRRFVALGTGGRGRGIIIFDLRRMVRLRAVYTGIAASGLAWVTPRRLLAILQSNELVVVDPIRGVVLRRRPIPRGQTGCTSAPDATSALAAARGLLVLLRSRGDGRALLLDVDVDGRVRSVALPRGELWGCGRSGLVADPDGSRAFVVSVGPTAAEVDLTTLGTRYRAVGGDPLRESQPREVSRLDDGKLVISGRDRSGAPAGANVVDTATWTNRALDRAAGRATAAGRLVLAYDGDRILVRPGRGVVAYTADGRRIFRVLQGKQINDVEHVGQRAYAISERMVYTIDLSTGRVIDARTSPSARVSITVLR